MGKGIKLDRCPVCKKDWVGRWWRKGKPRYNFSCPAGHEWSRRITFREHAEIRSRHRKSR